MLRKEKHLLDGTNVTAGAAVRSWLGGMWAWGGGVLLLAMAAGMLGCRERPREPLDVPVLMYHSVEIGSVKNTRLWIPVEVFERQIEALKKAGYTSVWPSDVVDYFRKGKPLPKKPIIITFDDGSRNLLTNAEPILARHGFRGVSYLITGRMAEDSTQATNAVYGRRLTWEDVRLIHARGTIRFGGHTRTHRALPHASDAEAEILGCFQDLRSHGIAKPEGFSYPFGQYSMAVKELVQRAGFRIAFTTENGIARLNTAGDLYTVGRIGVLGGRRAMKVASVDPQGATGTTVRISFESDVSRLVRPRFVWEGMAPQEGWMPECRVHKGDVDWLWPGTTSLRSSPGAALELWDRHGVVLVDRIPLP